MTTRTYLRWLPEERRRETWDEAVQRVITFLRETGGDKIKDHDYQQIHDAILAMEIMPSMRILAMGNDAIKRDNTAAYNCSFLPINDLRSFSSCLFILMQGVGCGFSVERKYTDQLPVVAAEDHDAAPTIFVIEDSTEAWSEALYVGLLHWFHGWSIQFDYSQIRPKGARLLTKGGRASGPKPLRDLMTFAKKLVRGATGRKLRPIECLDLCNRIAEIVVVGGVRRSSEIALTDLDDDEIRAAKQGAFWEHSPHRAMANISVAYDEKPTWEDFQKEWKALAESGSGERGIFSREAANTMKPARRTRWVEGTNPCGEINLLPYEFCNLCDVVARAEDTQETLSRKVRLATIVGTIQSCLTHFPYLGKQWEDTCNHERLLGISVTGEMDCPAFRDHPETMSHLREVATKTNRVFAKRLGINQSASITCVKPSGTASLVVNASSGIHPRYAKYFIRRVRISATDPLCKMLLDQGAPMVPENGQTEENVTTWVVEFPCKSPDEAITRHDVTALQQLEYWKKVKLNYTDHNPSSTIYVSANEWEEVGQWVFSHWSIVGGIAFLPKSDSDHVYTLAPYEEIDSDTYHKLVQEFPRLDYSQLSKHERSDHTTGSREYSCVGDKCEVV